MNIKYFKKLFSIAALMIAMTGANAQWYGEVAYVSATSKYTTSSIRVESNPKSIGAFIGYTLNENFAAEGLIGTGLGGTDVKVNGASQSNPVTSKTDYLYGAFLKPRAKLNDEFELFGRLGYIKGKFTSSNSSASSSDVKGDWAYGVGANYYFNKTTYVSASWMNFYNKDGVKFDGWTVGLGIKF
jgi:opacity protein-like surface antigen